MRIIVLVILSFLFVYDAFSQENAYASWKVPVKQVNLRFNAGPYLALNQVVSMGGSLETGVEYRKWYAGIAYFQNLTDQGSYFNLSLGYRISL